MTCREVADFLMAYLDGELPPPALAEFDQHLHRCENCRHYLARYKAATALGKRAFDDDNVTAAAAGVPEDLIHAILAARARRP